MKNIKKQRPIQRSSNDFKFCTISAIFRLAKRAFFRYLRRLVWPARLAWPACIYFLYTLLGNENSVLAPFTEHSTRQFVRSHQETHWLQSKQHLKAFKTLFSVAGKIVCSALQGETYMTFFCFLARSSENSPASWKKETQTIQLCSSSRKLVILLVL